MRLLLDTATFIWAVNSPQNLSKAAFSALQDETSTREISAISLSEIAIKQTRGKLAFDKDDLDRGIADLQLRVLPYTGNHAMRLFALPLHHADPFDRQIIAQAIEEDLAVVTPDHEFRRYKDLTIVW